MPSTLRFRKIKQNGNSKNKNIIPDRIYVIIVESLAISKNNTVSSTAYTREELMKFDDIDEILKDSSQFHCEKIMM